MADNLLEDDNPSPQLPPAAGDGGVEREAEPAPPSIRDALDAARKEVSEKASGGDRRTDQPATDETRPRDAAGRFIPKDGTVESAPKDTPPAQPEPQPAPSTAPTGPPPGWSAEAKAEWTKLPPAIQAAVVKREGEVSAGFAKYANRDREFEAVMGPRRKYYADQGVSDIQAIHNQWLWYEALQNSPQDAFPALAQLFGFDLSTVAPGAQADPENSRVAALEAEIRRLGGQVHQVTSSYEQQQMAARRAELDAFANGKPHFDKVRVTMGKLIQAGVAESLDDAYKQALRIVPEVASLVAADEKAAAEKAAAEAALRTRPANQRQAAVSVRGGAPNGAAGPPAPTSIRDSLKQGFADARGAI